MLITVAICTYNRATALEHALGTLTHLVPPHDARWELVVVDNASTDRTREVLAAFAGRLPLRVAFEQKSGLSHARNCALDNAGGDYVLWTDDDVEVDPGWLTGLVDGVRRFPEATVFGGPVRPWFPEPPDPDLVAAFPALALGFCGVDHALPEGPMPPTLNINGASMAFHRGRTASLRFDPTFGPTPDSAVVGDERNFIDRCRQRGAVVVWLPAMAVRHYVLPQRMSLEYLVRYYRDFAITATRRQGPPHGVRWFGVPRWVFREMAAAGLKTTVGRPLIDRAAYLLALRSYWYNRGVARECLAQWRRPAARPVIHAVTAARRPLRP